MEPPKKQPKIENGDIKEMLMTMQFSFINKLKNIEGKIEKLSSKYFLLEQKVESILLKAQDPTLKTPQSNVSCSSSNTSCISANDEEAYPEGSWLGDPNNRELRVRCNISPTDLELINNSCSTPEKMALLLLDYLFDREIQAKSNISGTGKHGKQQLDPLKIYGIKCHISYMFGINNKDWQRIKQNIDSKCRTAFQRKQKGMPLVVKGCRERFPWSVKSQILKSSKPISESALIENYTSENVMIPKLEKLEPSSVENVNEGNLNQMIPLKCEEGCSFMFAHAINHPQIIHTEHGDIQVIQATEEQLEELKQNHHIEILTEADIITDTALNASQ